MRVPTFDVCGWWLAILPPVVSLNKLEAIQLDHKKIVISAIAHLGFLCRINYFQVSGRKGSFVGFKS